MPGIVSAWLVGEGIIFWRTWKTSRSFPVPGQLLAASFVFVMLAILAESDRARGVATLTAWGFDIAAFLCMFNTDKKACGGAMGILAGSPLATGKGTKTA